MIKRNTEPSNKQFFDRVAPIMPYVVWAGIIFQVISGLTEFFGIYQFGGAIGAPIAINLLISIAIVVGWEFLIRVSVKYVTKTGAQKFRREITLEKLESVLIVLSFVIGIPAIYYSFAVSKENAHMTFEVMMPTRDTTTIAVIDQSKAADLEKVKSDYQSRKSEIERRYNEKEQAAKGVYLAAKTTHQTNIQEWQEREKSRGKKYTTYINREKDKINEAYTAYKTEVKAITEEKAEALASVDQWRDNMEGGAISMAGTGISEEIQKRETFKAWFRRFSVVWSHFAGLAVVFAVLCVIFSEVFKVLAGIQEETHVTPESLDPSLSSEILYLLHLKMVSPIRNRVRTAINKTASKRVDLEIVMPSRISVTEDPARYGSVTGGGRAVTEIAQRGPVTHSGPVTETVTQNRYAPATNSRNGELPTHVTPVTGQSVTHSKGGALPKAEPVTPPEAVVVELEPTVTGKKPEKVTPTVTDSPERVIMVSPTKAVIISPDGKKETVTASQVGSRKRSNKRNIDIRKTKDAKANARRLYEFYRDLEKQMKETK